MFFRESISTDDFEVRVSELLVATNEEADALIDASVTEVLRLLRERLRMDVVFVSEFRDNQRVFRAIEQPADRPLLTRGGSDPLEASWCQRVVDGRLPQWIHDAGPVQAAGQAPAAGFPIGTHISSPIFLQGGEVYGTLCCFSFGVDPDATDKDLQKLHYTARLLALKIDRARAEASELQLQPLT